MSEFTESMNEIENAIEMGIDGSLNPFTGAVPTTGYMVGGGTWTMVIPPFEFKREMLDLFVTAHTEQLSQGKMPNRFYIGWWTYNGKVYIDLAEQWNYKEMALNYARSLGELAVWDVANSEEIKVS